MHCCIAPPSVIQIPSLFCFNYINQVCRCNFFQVANFYLLRRRRRRKFCVQLLQLPVWQIYFLLLFPPSVQTGRNYLFCNLRYVSRSTQGSFKGSSQTFLKIEMNYWFSDRARGGQSTPKLYSSIFTQVNVKAIQEIT